MKIVDLHDLDEEVWQAPKIVVYAGAYGRAASEFGGSQNKSDEQKQNILIALYTAIVSEDIDRVKVLVKLLEARYEISRGTIPQLLMELQAEELQAA